jgi:hypothetical protein
MFWKTVLITMILSLIMAGTAISQQQQQNATQNDNGFLGGLFNGDDQPQQTFSGSVDRVGDDYVLLVGEKAYELDVDNEQLIEGFVLGQEVEVQGTLEDNVIQVERTRRADQEQDRAWEDQQQRDADRTNGVFGNGQEQQQQEQLQTFSGVIDRVGDDYVLIVGDMAYELDIDEDRLIADVIRGQEVDVRGTMDEETIEVDAVHPAGEMEQRPMEGRENNQTMEGQETGARTQ